MKYFIFIFLFIIVSRISNSQTVKNDTDSLRKYTYFIGGFSYSLGKTYFSSGSGYFVRDNKRIYFVTAQHVLDGCISSLDSCKPPSKAILFPNMMTIYLTNNGDMNYRFIPVYVKPIKDSLACIWSPAKPDVIAYEVTNLTKDTVYSIENFMQHKLPKKKGAISVFGFPSIGLSNTNGVLSVDTASHIYTDNYKFYEYYKYIACGGKKAIDSQDNVIKYNTPIEVKYLSGYSGSPAFIKDIRKDKWVFMGTFVSTIESDKLLFTKPKFTRQKIKESQ